MFLHSHPLKQEHIVLALSVRFIFFYSNFVRYFLAITEKKMFSFEQAKEMDRCNERRPVASDVSRSTASRLNKANSLDSSYQLFKPSKLGEHGSEHDSNPVINVINFNNNNEVDFSSFKKMSLNQSK
jgi:hypothetical protein